MSDCCFPTPRDNTTYDLAVIGGGSAGFSAAITAAEVATYYFDEELGDLLVPVLLVMMAVKFIMVVMWFIIDTPESRATHRRRVAGMIRAPAAMTIRSTK